MNRATLLQLERHLDRFVLEYAVNGEQAEDALAELMDRDQKLAIVWAKLAIRCAAAVEDAV